MQARRGAAGCLLLSLAGLSLCAYLGFLHIGLLRGELLGGAVCGGSGSVFNCHAVTAGPWGSALGVPLWVWGTIGYVAIFSLALIAWQFPDWTSPALTLLADLALVCVAVDAVLFTAMVTQIRYLCPLCLLTYVINLLLLFIVKRALAAPWPHVVGGVGRALGALVPSRTRPVAWVFWSMWLIGSSGAIAVHAATLFVSQGSPGLAHKQFTDFATKEPRVHPEVAGDPSVGPSTAATEVVEFSDFLCPACGRASKFNAIILANHRRDVHFVFKHFPLDTSCNDTIGRTLHPGACAIAAASECAHQQGKFWPVHDLVFEASPHYNPALLEQDARRLGVDGVRYQSCMASGEGMQAVKRDVEEGKRLGITSTPTYVINGLKVPAIVSPSMFEELLSAMRDAAR